MTQHSKSYPPSSATRYINCPGSVITSELYPNDDTVHSEKGDLAHFKLETGIIFGIRPRTDDPTMDEHVELVLDWVDSKRRQGKTVLSERRFNIPETGEWGTCDIPVLSQDETEIADYKNGYVLVDVRDKYGVPADQLMTYLLGAIAEYGPRPKYRITIHQPNASHVDGPIRSTEITPQEVEDFRARTLWAVSSREFIAGPHCKKTYCPHRGACPTFNDMFRDNYSEGFHSSEVHAMSDDKLAVQLDLAETFHGYRDELRKEAMRRMLNMDRKIPGYGMYKGRQDRAFINEEEAKRLLLEYGASDDDMYTKKFTTVKGAEDYVKKLARQAGRGKWKEIWDMFFQPIIRENAGGLTLERATYGGVPHKRGSEFTALLSAPDTSKPTFTV